MDKIYELYERYSDYEFEEILDFYANYDYSQYDGIKNAAAGAGLSWILAIVGVVAFVALTLAILSYVFFSVGLFRTAKNLGIVAPWIAFIPVANIYLLGRVAQGNGEGKRKFPFGWILLVLSFASACFDTYMTGKITTGIIDVTSGMTVENVVPSLESIFTFIGGPLVTNILIMMAASFALSLFFYVTLYFVYKVCADKCAPLYLAISIVFPVFIPFFLFACRNNTAKEEIKTAELTA